MKVWLVGNNEQGTGDRTFHFSHQEMHVGMKRGAKLVEVACREQVTSLSPVLLHGSMVERNELFEVMEVRVYFDTQPRTSGGSHFLAKGLAVAPYLEMVLF